MFMKIKNRFNPSTHVGFGLSSGNQARGKGAQGLTQVHGINQGNLVKYQNFSRILGRSM